MVLTVHRRRWVACIAAVPHSLAAYNLADLHSLVEPAAVRSSCIAVEGNLVQVLVVGSWVQVYTVAVDSWAAVRKQSVGERSLHEQPVELD